MAIWNSGNLITAGDMSADISDSLVIDVLNTGRLENGRMSIQAIAASATHVGTLAIQFSNDNTNWEDVTLDDGTTSVAAASGAAFAEFISKRSESTCHRGNHCRTATKTPYGCDVLLEAPGE